MDENLLLQQRRGQQHRRGRVAAAADDDVGLEFAQDEKTFDRAQENGRQGENGFRAFDVLRQAAGRDMDELHGLGEGGDDAGFAAFSGADVEEFGVGIFFLQGFIDGDIGIDMAAGAAAGKKESVFVHVGLSARIIPQ